MTMLTKAAILAAVDLQAERVDVPEWGGHVFVRSLPAADYEKFVQAAVKFPQELQGYHLLVRCLVDAEGVPLFGDDDIEALRGKHGGIMLALINRAGRLNRLGEETIEDAKKKSD